MFKEEDLLREIKSFTRTNKKTGKVYETYRKKIAFKTPDGSSETKEFYGKTPEETARRIMEYQENLSVGASFENDSKTTKPEKNFYKA
jgi:hypothetical protein